MRYLRRPIYYKEFKCIASECTDSCCKEWEIDIDEETLEYYMTVDGEFGKRLKDNIMISEDEIPHFIQTKNERCPFLNEEGLCDIFINLGEEHLSQICTHHPRFYDWFTEGEEAGLGMCCESAVRLILRKNNEADFEEIFNEDFLEENNIEAGFLEDDEEDFTKELENELFGMRLELFNIIKSDNISEKDYCNNNTKLEFIVNKLYKSAEYFQKKYDNLVFGETDEKLDAELDAEMDIELENCQSIDSELGQREFSKSVSELFWNKDNLINLIEYYKKLEINDINWWNTLNQLDSHEIDNIIDKKEMFEKFYSEKMHEYEQLLIYFIFRYFMKARNDDMVIEKVNFAIISTYMIELLDIFYYEKNGKLSEKNQVDICKMYSKEIEYDEDNVEKLSEYFLQ